MRSWPGLRATWIYPAAGFAANIADPKKYTIAYFSAEYGLHHALPFYAGGLGFLAGDFLKECSDLGMPLGGGGLHVSARVPAPDDLAGRLAGGGLRDAGSGECTHQKDGGSQTGDPISVKVPVMDPPIYLEVWKVQVGKTGLYLIDTSSEANDPWNRVISDRLYTGDLEQRLRQEIVLGIGGVRILQASGGGLFRSSFERGPSCLCRSGEDSGEGGGRNELPGCLRSRSRTPRSSPRTRRCLQAMMSFPISSWTSTSAPIFPHWISLGMSSSAWG